MILEILTAFLKMALTFAGGIVALAVALLHRLADEIDKRRGRR